MKFKLTEPDATLNILLEPEDIQEIIQTGRVRPKRDELREFHEKIYEPDTCSDKEGAPKWIQFLCIRCPSLRKEENK